MNNRIKYEIKTLEDTVTLTVRVEDRFVNRESTTFFSTEDALNILLEKKINYDIMISSPVETLSNDNKGSIQFGEWVFSKKKETKNATRKQQKRTTTKRRTTTDD